MFELRPTTKYRRDIRRLKRRGLNLEALVTAHDLLICTGTLSDQYRPHPLRGEYASYIDAHIAPDWVIIYKQYDEYIVLLRTGTHQDLFNNY